jgi:hypothetical protein
MPKKFYKNTRENVVKIFRALKATAGDGAAGDDGGFLSVGEVARRAGLHKWTVSRTLDLWMSPVLEMVVPEELEAVGLKIKLVRLARPDITEEQVLKCLSVLPAMPGNGQQG